jgi:hypothetical protein
VSALDALLGKPGEPPTCKVMSADLAVHWFASHEIGAVCLCGATIRAWDDFEDEPARPESGERDGGA